jgi:hypothetical protein
MPKLGAQVMFVKTIYLSKLFQWKIYKIPAASSLLKQKLKNTNGKTFVIKLIPRAKEVAELCLSYKIGEYVRQKSRVTLTKQQSMFRKFYAD